MLLVPLVTASQVPTYLLGATSFNVAMFTAKLDCLTTASIIFTIFYSLLGFITVTYTRFFVV